VVGNGCASLGSRRGRSAAVAPSAGFPRTSVPSMDVNESAAGVSKGAFTHHFRTRSALLARLAEQAIASMEEALDAAVATGGVVRTWLQISMPRKEADLYRALLMSFNEGKADSSELLRRTAPARQRS
jgi:AcrR family transcriptional regulator